MIRLGRSGDPITCPVRSIARRIIHLCNNNAPLNTPLGRAYTPDGVSRVTPRLVTAQLRNAVKRLGFDLGFLPKEVRAAGTTTLLVAKVDPDVIQLLGRRRSDEMMRYLHLSAGPVTKDFARLQIEFMRTPN